jgi:hypothetical protein
MHLCTEMPRPPLVLICIRLFSSRPATGEEITCVKLVLAILPVHDLKEQGTIFIDVCNLLVLVFDLRSDG